MSPDGSTKTPPEEKLLRLIRGRGPKPSPPAVAASPKPAGRARHLPRHSLSLREHGVRWPRLAVGVLAAVVVSELIALGVQLTRPMPVITTPPASASDGGSREPARIEPLPSLSEAAVRNIFASPITAAPTPAPPAPVVKTGPSASAKLLASRLTLMGIVSGEPPQAIIEDAQTKKTYFVSVGQVVVDGAVLQQVLDNRVLLELDGESIELSL